MITDCTKDERPEERVIKKVGFTVSLKKNEFDSVAGRALFL
jgi:hypothetical protein